MIYRCLEWTDAQWEKYNKTTVTIGLDFLDHLATAVELLKKGARLTLDEREQWTGTSQLCKEILEKELDKIQ